MKKKLIGGMVWFRINARRLTLFSGILALMGALAASIFGWHCIWIMVLVFSFRAVMRARDWEEDLSGLDASDMRQMRNFALVISLVGLVTGLWFIPQIGMNMIIPIPYIQGVWIGLLFLMVCIICRQHEIVSIGSPSHDEDDEE